MRDFIVYGLGELGRLYGSAALRAGLRVTPVTRALDPADVFSHVPGETPILVAVGEDALDDVLSALGPRGNDAILLQNELFPSSYQKHEVTPTVMVPWVLKKRGVATSVARPTPVFGRHADLVCELHQALDLPVTKLREEAALHQALIEKYAFIITINALGLLRDRTLGMWLQEDPIRVHAIGLEAAQLGAILCEQQDVDLAKCARVVVEGMRALGTTGARGRTAGSRIARALAHGKRIGIALPELSRAEDEARRT